MTYQLSVSHAAGIAVRSIILFNVLSTTVVAQETVIQPVDNSPLAEMKGFAAAFRGDDGIARQPAVIFADNFETGEPGSLWDETSNASHAVLSVVDESSTGAPVGTGCIPILRC